MRTAWVWLLSHPCHRARKACKGNKNANSWDIECADGRRSGSAQTQG